MVRRMEHTHKYTNTHIPARDIERGRVVEICEDAKVLVDAIGLKMSKNEVGHINESLKKGYSNTKAFDKGPQENDNNG